MKKLYLFVLLISYVCSAFSAAMQQPEYAHSLLSDHTVALPERNSFVDEFCSSMLFAALWFGVLKHHANNGHNLEERTIFAAASVGIGKQAWAEAHLPSDDSKVPLTNTIAFYSGAMAGAVLGILVSSGR